jgi:hypothetical protein
MPLNLKIDVVTDRFDAMLNDMANIDPTVEFRTIVLQMAIRVIQGAANRTRAATIESIRKSEDHYYLTKDWMTLDGKKYLIQGTGTQGHMNHYPDALWGRIQAVQTASSAFRLQKKLASRGLAKQSWANLALALGGSIDVPGWVMTANYNGAQYPHDVSFSEDKANGKYGLTIVNSSPIVGAAGGLGALLGSMQAEVGYFRQNMAHGFYTTLARRAAKYPGIFVREI